MRVHYNTPIGEFITELRYAAIDQKAPAVIIDAIDRLRDSEDLEAQLEKVSDDLYNMEKAKDDLFEELELLVKAIDENLDSVAPRLAIENALKAANLALERHRP